MKNEIRFTLESKQRPKLAQEIGNILGTAPHYERVPSCAYDIAGYRLDKEGVLHIPEGTEKETVEDLIRQLRERGFQDDALFLFCGRKCDRIKAILKEPDGIVMIYKRLTAQGSYRWPRSKSEVRNLTWREFDWLMSGIDIEQPKAIRTT